MAKTEGKTPVEKDTFLDDLNKGTETPKDGAKLKPLLLVSAADYWDFEQHPEFTGLYTGDHHSSEEGEEGTIIGFNFIDKEGQDWLITNSYSIQKALDMDYNGKPAKNHGLPFRITFKSKVKIADGKYFNKFRVELMVPEK